MYYIKSKLIKVSKKRYYCKLNCTVLVLKIRVQLVLNVLNSDLVLKALVFLPEEREEKKMHFCLEIHLPLFSLLYCTYTISQKNK